MIPLVELALETCLDRGCGGQTTRTVKPGLIWFGKYLQRGVEATVCQAIQDDCGATYRRPPG